MNVEKHLVKAKEVTMVKKKKKDMGSGNQVWLFMLCAYVMYV